MSTFGPVILLQPPEPLELAVALARLELEDADEEAGAGAASVPGADAPGYSLPPLWG